MTETTVNKVELIAKIAEELGESKALVGRVMDALKAEVIEAVAAGREVKWAGFLAVDVADRAARVTRNPRTGENIEVPARKAVRVRPLTDLKRAAVS